MEKKNVIQLETISRSGHQKIVTGRHSATVKEFLALMEDAIHSGRYSYVAVLVDGEVIEKFEA